ncbi:MAG TPA: hypothetical protein ENJ46_04890 [Hellea balneolensis]|uniref:LPS-assembly lipoprotein n=1 Tax=Hellea balneolensis TaxID=287478 RepID=A0A7C3C9D9_9PROT|nr:hypothetical protein [Hellea balneolensis]
MPKKTIIPKKIPINAFRHLACGLGSALMLSACGFEPMHATNALNGASAVKGGVVFREISVVTSKNDKEDFLLKQALRDRLGDNSNTRYTLRVVPTTSRRNLGIGADDVASRYDLIMTARFELLDAKTGDVLMKDKIRAISTFGAPRDPYGTASAQNNADRQVAAEAADRIIVRLARYQKRGLDLSKQPIMTTDTP